jgi:dipeptidyl aminopeptidase/acylaminoacyl peptidase
VKPAQLELLTTVSAPALAPDGSAAIVAASRPSFAADAAVGQLWLVDPAGAAAPRRFTRGVRDTNPQYSPDGSAVAFLRADAKGRPQLAVVDARGGEPRVLTDRPLGVREFAWSPDSARIAFTAGRPDPGRYGTLEGVGPEAEDPRRITGWKYRENGTGYTGDQRPGIFLLEVPDPGEEPFVEPVGRAARDAGSARFGARAGEQGGELGGEQSGEPGPGFPAVRLLTPPDREASGPVFSPDGTHLYFTAALHAEADRDLRSMVHRVRLDTPGLPPQAVAGGPADRIAYWAPAFSRDGGTLYLLGEELGPDGLDFVARNGGVFAVNTADLDPAGQVSGAPRPLTDRDALDYGEAGRLVPYGRDSVLACTRVRGGGQLHAIGPDGGAGVLLEGRLEVAGAAEAGGTVVVSYADPTTPGELGVVADGLLRPATAFAAPLAAATRIAVPQELTVAAPDGHPVHGWVFLPEGQGPHPVLLNIHGGPYSQYGWGYFDEAQVYARAGYAVVQCNPRGSAGYGRDHGLAIRGAMGTVDLDDVLAFLDGAVAAVPGLDGTRTGILGGSYGGYLTAWTIAHDHRFAAAIVERGFLDPLSFIGSSDIGWFFGEAYTGTDPEHTLKQSPLAVAAQVRTPTLVIHSEQDLRCPVEQAQRYYVGLKRAGVEAEMLLFPGEDHELSRSGTPWHRRQRFEAILDWWDRHLPASPWPAAG